jgi:hypothetical protein
MIDTRRYPAQVFWSDDDKGGIAVATDLNGPPPDLGKTPPLGPFLIKPMICPSKTSPSLSTIVWSEERRPVVHPRKRRQSRTMEGVWL